MPPPVTPPDATPATACAGPSPLPVRASASDAEAIAALHASLFPDAWSAADVRPLVEGPTGAAWRVPGAEGGSPRGFLIGRIAADEAELLSIGVAPEARRTGLAATLVRSFADAARRAGATRLFLEVAADNHAARALYERLGFVEVGRRKGYYRVGPGHAVDAHCLALTLSAR